MSRIESLCEYVPLRGAAHYQQGLLVLYYNLNVAAINESQIEYGNNWGYLPLCIGWQFNFKNLSLLTFVTF